MKKNLFVAEQGYEAPALQLFDIAVEQGFANSVSGDVIEDWESDGDGLNFN